MILDKLGTEEQLIDDEIPKDIPKYANRDGFSRLTKKDMVAKIVEICNQYKLETNNSFLRSSLDTIKIKYNANPTEIRTMITCLLYTSPSPRDRTRSRMPSSA